MTIRVAGMKVFILGAGKVGRAFAHLLKKHGDTVTLQPARKGVPTRPIAADIVVLAIRDKQLGAVAADLATSGVVSRKAVVVHASGAMATRARPRTESTNKSSSPLGMWAWAAKPPALR